MSKIAVIYYSFSGNTKRACLFLKNHLSGKEVDLISLVPQNQEGFFFKQCFQAFTKHKPRLSQYPKDLKNYDFLVFASPVWAFTFAPALRSYLEQIQNFEKKKTACILTYGSGSGSQKALQELTESLKGKGARILFSKRISGSKAKNGSYMLDNLKTLLEILRD